MRRSQNDDVLSGPMVTGVGKVGFRHWLPGAPRGRIAHDHLGGYDPADLEPGQELCC